MKPRKPVSIPQPGFCDRCLSCRKTLVSKLSKPLRTISLKFLQCKRSGLFRSFFEKLLHLKSLAKTMFCRLLLVILKCLFFVIRILGTCCALTHDRETKRGRIKTLSFAVIGSAAACHLQVGMRQVGTDNVRERSVNRYPIVLWHDPKEEGRSK